MPTTELPQTMLEGVTLSGGINVSHDVVLSNIQHSIRLGYPQLWQQPVRGEEVCLVGGGPSLEQTEQELVDLVHNGALLVTMNGSYRWCLDRNLKPNAQIVLDARASNARFVEPIKPWVRYYLASQCHPDTWSKVDGHPYVGIFHALSKDDPCAAELDSYYLGQWQTCNGGTTVGSRAIGLCRMLGYLKFHLFGFDCAWSNGASHAYPQAENDADKWVTAGFHPNGHPELMRKFVMSPWHIKQLDELILFVRGAGQQFLWDVHGDGALAYALSSAAVVREPCE